MTRFLRFSASNLALGYITLSIGVLTLFATPLGMAWREGIDEARTEDLQRDVQLLSDMFSKRGVPGLVAALDSYLNMPFVPARTILFADDSLSRIAGNLPAWPPEVPDSPGTHDLTLDRDGSSMQLVVIHATLPGGYRLLVGREISRFKELEFCSGMDSRAPRWLSCCLAGWAER